MNISSKYYYNDKKRVKKFFFKNVIILYCCDLKSCHKRYSKNVYIYREITVYFSDQNRI